MAVNRILRTSLASDNSLNLKDGCYALLLAFTHSAVSIFYTLGMGISITADPKRNTWDWFWQSVPVDLLKTDLLHSIWYLHAQPPLYNLFLGVLVKLFSPYHLQILHAINILLGALLSGMLYIIIVQLLPNRLLAFGLAFVLAMNPSLFLFEAYILYSLICAFLVVLNIFCLYWHYTTKSTLALYCFIGSLNMLILTRSLYHVLLLSVALTLILFLTNPSNRKRTLIIGSAICIIAFGWCIKNYFLYGFFGTSSWYGMGLWKIASHRYNADELKSLVNDGLLDPMVVEKEAFEEPSEYRPYGFDKSSNISALSRDNYNNVNIPDVSRVYGSNASRLIIQQPLRYVRSVYGAYLIFCKPSSQFKHLPLNAVKIKHHKAFYSVILQGRFLMSRGKIDHGSFLFFLLPIALALYTLQLFFRVRARESLGTFIRNDAIMFWCFILIVYTTFLSCSVEYGEQDRFKFDIEQIMWVFMPVVFLRCIAWLNRAKGNIVTPVTRLMLSLKR